MTLANRATLEKEIKDDVTSKQLTIHCPPILGGGPKILLAFTGLAEMPDGTPTVQWIRETIRGEQRFIMPMIEHLRDRLTRDVGKSRLWRVELTLIGGVLEADGRRGYLQLSNVIDPITRQTGREFRYLLNEMPEPVFMAGGGGQRYIARRDAKLVVQQSKIRPAKWEDHMGLLAAVNRRTAARVPDKSVSPWCHVTSVGVDGEATVGRSFHGPGEPAPVMIDTVVSGLDFTEVLRLVRTPGVPWSKEEEAQALRQQGEGRP